MDEKEQREQEPQEGETRAAEEGLPTTQVAPASPTAPVADASPHPGTVPAHETAQAAQAHETAPPSQAHETPAPQAGAPPAPNAAETAEVAPVQVPAREEAPAETGTATLGTAAKEQEGGFGEILAAFEQGGSGERKPDPAVGERVSGKVVSVGDETVFVDLGTKSEGVIETAQLRDAEGNLTVSPGDTLQATVSAIDPETGALVLKKRTGGGRGQQEVATELRQAFQYGMPVEGMVTGINKGGAEVQVFGMRAFCPLSQLDLRYVEGPERFIGQKLSFKVNRIEEGKKGRRPDIVLSRRALLEDEAQAKASQLRAHLHVGAVMKGTVTSLTTYGAFIDLGGLEGLLHVSEIGFSRLADPKEVLSVGQEVEVQVIKIEKGKDEKRPERISLSRKALERDPWRDAADRFPDGATLTGRVVRLESFGAFVELSPGLEGLVHVSEMGAGRRISHAREAVQLGQDVQVRVLGVDRGKRRISLSMAAHEEPPEHDEPPPREAPPSNSGQQPSSFGALGDFFKTSRRR